MKKNSNALPQQGSDNEKRLYMAFELAEKKWRIRFGDGKATRDVVIDSRDLLALEKEIRGARKRFSLDAAVRVASCYEAGRDGFWLHRALVERGIDNVVVDPASIAVDRRMRRAKTDRIDVGMLLSLLIRHHVGGDRVWVVVRVPAIEAEDARRPNRELARLTKERTQHIARMKSLLALQGLVVGMPRGFPNAIALDTLLRERRVPPNLSAELRREHKRFEMINVQIREIEKARDELLRKGTSPAVKKVRLLSSLRGVGTHSAWLFVSEFFGWRVFQNRREVGSAAGLTPTPYATGDSHHEQGISKAGNARIRAMLVEIGWTWLKYQPESKLSRWFQDRFGTGKRTKRIGIVALARKLIIDLWRFVEHGVVPEGALLKKTVATSISA